MPSYPKALVERFGIDVIRKKVCPHIQRIQKSKARSIEEKVDNFIKTHPRFHAWMCAKYCSAKKSEILPILMARKDLKCEDGLFSLRKSRTNRSKLPLA